MRYLPKKPTSFRVCRGWKKTAQKIALHLKDKLKPMDALARVAAMSDVDSEVLAALTSLGYSVVEAQAAIQSLPKDAPQDTGERLRLALAISDSIQNFICSFTF